MKKITLIISALILSSCASAPYYQKSGENGFHRLGYTETKISSDSYRVSYLDVDSTEAYKKFLMRSSELALANNHPHFIVRDASAYIDSLLPAYSGTVVFQKTKSENTHDAKEIISTNPIPRQEPKRQISSRKSCSGFQCTK